MKQRIKNIIVGVLIGAVLSGGAVYARTGTDTIDVTYRDIAVYKDNVLVDMTNSTGDVIEPFIYNGTTYVPLRKAGEIAGMQVQWDGKTSSIHMWDKLSPGTNYLTDVCPPYQIVGNSTAYYSNDAKSFSMCGEEFANGLTHKGSLFSEGGAYFNLNGEYESMTFTLGPVDGEAWHKDIRFSIYLDDVLYETYTVSRDDYLKTITIPLDYALQMRVVVDKQGDAGSGKTTGAGMGNIIVK